MRSKERMEFHAYGRKSVPKANLRSTKSGPFLPLGPAPPPKAHRRRVHENSSDTSTIALPIGNRALEGLMNTDSSPEPEPYLEPIRSKVDKQRPRDPQILRIRQGESAIPPPKILLLRPDSGRKVTRSQSNRVPNSGEKKVVRARKRELAYLIVDLQTGQPTYTSASLGESQLPTCR